MARDDRATTYAILIRTDLLAYSQPMNEEETYLILLFESMRMQTLSIRLEGDNLSLAQN